MCYNGIRIDESEFSMVEIGIDRVREPEYHNLLSRGRLGVISAASGVSSSYRYSIDLLHEQFNVGGIFAPEHGSRGMLGPGELVNGGEDPFTHLPVYSLYQESYSDKKEKKRVFVPTDESLRGIDRMVFDMQDVGSRYFTYASTLYYAMQACGEKGIPLTVLDRPNPLGGAVEGNCLDPKYRSFIGLTSVPIRHGMTLGELARFYNGEYHLGCDLSVIPVRGWKREMYFDETGLPFVRPSPNLPTFESVLVYNGTCLFAGTNVSEGRGTTCPFTIIGAPYINPIELADRLNADRSIEGVRFSPAFFIPLFSVYRDQKAYGVQLHVTDKRALRPVALGVKMIEAIRELYPEEFRFTPPSVEGARWHVDIASGNTDLRLSGLSSDELMEKWNAQAERFRSDNEKYHLYE